MKRPLTGRSISDLMRDYIEATRLAEEFDLDPALRERLAAYRRLIEKQQHRIGLHPAALLPVAHAEPLDSLVRQDALAREASHKLGRPWLRRLHCPETDTNPALLATINVGSKVTAVAVFDWNGRLHALVGCNDGVLRLYDLTTQERVREFAGHTGEVTAVAVTAGGQAVSGSDDQTVRVWDQPSNPNTVYDSRKSQPSDTLRLPHHKIQGGCDYVASRDRTIAPRVPA